MFIPYYFDAGAGGSKLTWQIASGLGNRTRLADVSLTYRYLTWQQSNSFNVRSLSINGPMLMVNFSFFRTPPVDWIWLKCSLSRTPQQGEFPCQPSIQTRFRGSL